MKLTAIHLLAFAALTSCSTPTSGVDRSSTAHFEPLVFGLELDVADLNASRRFYCEAFAFEADPLRSCSKQPVLALGQLAIALRESQAAVANAGSAHWNLNLRVRSIDAWRQRVLDAGGRIEGDTQPFALGRWLGVRDPDGHPVHLLEIAGEPTTLEIEPFNVGATFVDLTAAEPEFGNLGFAVFSRDYLPDALPLQLAGGIAVVLHPGAESPADASKRTQRLLLQTEDLDGALDELASRGLFSGLKPFASGPLGRSVVLHSADGIELRLVERSAEFLAFERLRTLAGIWEGSSTKGWTERVSIEAIAGGSAVLDKSFDAHPGEAMLTMFSMDGPHLVLVHYCVAGNVPHLRAKRIEDDGRTITFEFEDGLNLGSRDQGHMDQVVIRLSGPDEFSSVWSWFQAGKASWMEEIRYRRQH